MYNTTGHSAIKTFADLNSWKEAHKLVLLTYKLTKKFPKNELFALTNQMTRASVSVSSNIAEGFSRGSSKDKVNFYRMALGSLTELQNQFYIAKDVNYVETSEFNIFMNQSIVVHKLINGLIKGVEKIRNT